MDLRFYYVRNYNNNDYSYVLGNYQDVTEATPSSVPDGIHFTVPEGKYFKEWNTERDGSGDTYYPGVEYSFEEYPEPEENTDYTKIPLYAIWDDIRLHYVTNADLTALANALRIKNNINITLSWPSGFIAWANPEDDNFQDA